MAIESPWALQAAEALETESAEWTPEVIAFTALMGLGAASLSFILGATLWSLLFGRRK